MLVNDVRGREYFLLQVRKNVDKAWSGDTHSQLATRTDVFLALPGGLGLRPI